MGHWVNSQQRQTPLAFLPITPANFIKKSCEFPFSTKNLPPGRLSPQLLPVLLKKNFDYH
jgi:hypothetical protein